MMMKFRKTGKYLIAVLLAAVLTTMCREKYVPKLNDPVTGYLVVDGFINGGAGATTIFLSRTTRLSSSPSIVRETGALVTVVGGSSSFPLAEVSAGIYTNPQLTLDPNTMYFVRVRTKDGKYYESVPSRVRKTPDIDSVFWRRENNGVQIYADTHDDNTPVGYYQFRYDETWEFISKYTTALRVFNRQNVPSHIGYRDSVNFGDDLSIWRCWRTDTSKNILIASTAKLTKNMVANFPVTFIEPNSVRLDIRYSINVHLYAISQAAHTFQEQLKKNTELLGSIFDGQPSDNYGNVKCITDPSEPVMGFVEVSEQKSKRIFINSLQVPGWTYINACAAEVKIANSMVDLRGKDYYLPTHVANGNIDSAYFAPATCVDCTLSGTNKKPTFW